MTTWNEIEQIFEEADKLKALEELYMERGNVTREQARAWALQKWNDGKLPKPCPFCGVLPIPESGKILYELHHGPGCFMGGRIRFGASELERWNTRTDLLVVKG